MRLIMREPDGEIHGFGAGYAVLPEPPANENAGNAIDEIAAVKANPGQDYLDRHGAADQYRRRLDARTALLRRNSIKRLVLMGGVFFVGAATPRRPPSSTSGTTRKRRASSSRVSAATARPRWLRSASM